jgi:nitrite reductase (NADH) small subunit
MTGWTQIGRAADVPLLEGRSATVVVPGTGARRLAVFRLPGGWAATDAACPHRGGPLGDGIVTASCVTCPLHQRRFDLVTGEQVGGPDRVVVHEIAERDGMLWVRLAQDAGEADGALREAA